MTSTTSDNIPFKRAAAELVLLQRTPHVELQRNYSATSDDIPYYRAALLALFQKTLPFSGATELAAI